MTHGGTLLSCFSVFTDAGVFQQQVQYVLVIFDQTRAGKAGAKLFGDLLDLIGFQPAIDLLKLLSQNRKHDNFGEIFPEGMGGILFFIGQIDDLPAKAAELIEQRLFNMVSFVKFNVPW